MHAFRVQLVLRHNTLKPKEEQHARIIQLELYMAHDAPVGQHQTRLVRVAQPRGIPVCVYRVRQELMGYMEYVMIALQGHIIQIQAKL